MAELNKMDRKAAEKFWNHLSSLSNRTSMEQRLITSVQEVRLEGYEAMKYKKTMMVEKFKHQESAACTVPGEYLPGKNESCGSTGKT